MGRVSMLRRIIIVMGLQDPFDAFLKKPEEREGS